LLVAFGALIYYVDCFNQKEIGSVFLIISDTSITAIKKTKKRSLIGNIAYWGGMTLFGVVYAAGHLIYAILGNGVYHIMSGRDWIDSDTKIFIAFSFAAFAFEVLSNTILYYWSLYTDIFKTIGILAISR
jgi:hypothetical protein